MQQRDTLGYTLMASYHFYEGARPHDGFLFEWEKGFYRTDRALR